METKAIILRLPKRDYLKLKLDFDQHLAKNGYWTKRGNRQSFNRWAIDRLMQRKRK